MNKEPALKYIPQRPPFVMVDDILYCDRKVCTTTFEVKLENVLLENNFLLEAGIIENIAQTCAAKIGYIGIHFDKTPVRIGVIGSVKDLEVYFKPKVGDVLITTVEEVLAVGDITVLNAKSKCNDKIVASCEMKVALTNN